MVTKVQKQRIKRFVKALRSGKYKQTTGKLQNANSYCCLGVACDLYRIDMGLKSPSVIATKWVNVMQKYYLRRFKNTTVLKVLILS